MVEGSRLHRRAIVGVCLLLWAASGCASLYFEAHDYYSWAANVLLFQGTTISRRNGWLQLNPYSNFTVGRALYKSKFQIQNTLNNSVASFNTSFIFSMNTDRGRDFFGDGLAFLICPGRFLNDNFQVSSGGYLGMFNASTNGLADNRIFAVEFDTHQNSPFHDPNDNHIGVDINSVHSLRTNDLSSLGIILNEGRKIVCWIDYDGGNRYIWVYLAYSPSNKPSSPIIAMDLDLAPYMRNNAYVGFTSSTGQRAELHTIYSWWFLSGFGNLSLPTSTSSRPLESLGRRSVVITVFTLAVAVGFLCLFCILARQRWQKESQHLIDVLLPVACWVYWKESIMQEVRLKLSKPTIELLAWLWRTRWVRRKSLPRVKTWRQMLLNSKMGPLQKGEAWQLEDQKLMQSCGAPKGQAHEQPPGKTTATADIQPKAAIKDTRLKPKPRRKLKEMETKKKKLLAGKPRMPSPSATDPDLEIAEMQDKCFEPRLKNFRISNASFILMDEESPAKIADVPVVTLSKGQSQAEHEGSSASSDKPGTKSHCSDFTSLEMETVPRKLEESPHPSSSADSGGHATQSWIFD